MCSTVSGWGLLYTQYVCPDGSSPPMDYNSPSLNQLIACKLSVLPLQPPPKICLSCLGNPIYAGTGQKMQAETDYDGMPGMKFTRTYWSNNGAFSSVLNQTFVNNSTPPGTISPACFPAHYTSSYGSGFYCFYYISTYTYVDAGNPQYWLQGADGRTIYFTGPNSAVTAAADINDRVTQVTVGGSSGWQVNRDDDSIELYNGTGQLVQKTLRGGRVLTYTYSTSSTPTSIAPWRDSSSVNPMRSATPSLGNTIQAGR